MSARAILCGVGLTFASCATSRSGANTTCGYYPAEARIKEIEGDVELRITIDARGVVREVEVLSGPGYGLNEAARDNMLKCGRFKPVLKNGEAVESTFTYTYRFLLD